MFSLILGLLNEIWILFVEMAPYLLLGFLVAGLLNLFLTREQVAKHLSERRFSSIWKASLLGIPLPLCSCGVIPVAAHLDKQGANRGATLSFLISTPTTGVDSILATYGLLGPLLTIARPVAALVNG
ncbi:MAG: permease, partial [Calditrichaeota bacterium]|nr:permease [Calditrichota bacterium]